MQLAAFVPSCAATQDQYLEKKTVRPTDDAILGHMQQAQGASLETSFSGCH